MPKHSQRPESTLQLLKLFQEENKEKLEKITGVSDREISIRILNDKIKSTAAGKSFSPEVQKLILRHSKVKVSACFMIDKRTGKEAVNSKVKQVQNNFKAHCFNVSKNDKRRKKYRQNSRKVRRKRKENPRRKLILKWPKSLSKKIRSKKV